MINSLAACGEDCSEAEILLEEFEWAQERRLDEIDCLLEMLALCFGKRGARMA
jgi:hypothetical protein